MLVARWGRRRYPRTVATGVGGLPCRTGPLAAIKHAGFEVERHERFHFQPAAALRLTAPRILGVARAPRR